MVHRAFGVPAIILVLATLANAGCGTLAYYGQAAAGQVRILAASRDIDRVIASGRVTPEVAGRLAAVREITRFAVDELHLPESRSYRRYADIDREHVVWNVFAAGEFSTRARTWCFPVAGCVAYRGYFSEAAARRFAESLARRGDDVFVGGVDAYSTLGYLPDPVLSTFIDYPPAEIAALVFHELAHQLVYTKDDSAFNESFASAVEEFGVQRWLAAGGDEDALAAYRRRRDHALALAALMRACRDRLDALYREPLAEENKRALKQSIMDELYSDYVVLASGHGVSTARRSFARRDLNNALLSSFDVYHLWLPVFRDLLDAAAGDLEGFYDTARELAALTFEQRQRTLHRLMSNPGGTP